MKTSKVQKSLKSFFLYTAYAGDSTFFLKNIPPVKELINSFNQFYHFSGLKANIETCEIADIGSQKGVTQAASLKCVNLSNDIIKILAIHFAYNKKVQMQNNFITTIKNAASSSFAEFRYSYP